MVESTSKKVKVEELDKIEILVLSNNKNNKTAYIIGGIHGNELQAIRGVEVLK
jgi:predicted deacylase